MATLSAQHCFGAKACSELNRLCMHGSMSMSCVTVLCIPCCCRSQRDVLSTKKSDPVKAVSPVVLPVDSLVDENSRSLKSDVTLAWLMKHLWSVSSVVQHLKNLEMFMSCQRVPFSV